MSLDEIVARRRRDDFIGRVQEIEHFTKNIELSSGDNQKKFIFSVTGPAGVGKTTLLHHVRGLILTRGGLAAYVDIAELEPIEVMFRIAEQLSPQGKHLGNLLNKLDTYRKKVQELKADPSAPKDLAGGIGRLTAETAVFAARQLPVPGVNAVLDAMPTSSIMERSGEWASFVAAKLKNRNEQRLLTEPLAVLTSALLTDIARKLRGCQVVILLDGYERTTSVDPWLRKLLSGEYGEVPSDIMWITSEKKSMTPVSGFYSMRFSLGCLFRHLLCPKQQSISLGRELLRQTP